MYGSGSGGARSSREKAAFGKEKKLNPNFHEPFQTVAPNQLYIQLVQNQCKILVKSQLKKRKKINKLKNKKESNPRPPSASLARLPSYHNIGTASAVQLAVHIVRTQKSRNKKNRAHGNRTLIVYNTSTPLTHI